MTPITHHISDALLLEYAAGTLEEGWSLAVATHLALCPDCRKRLALMEAAGGALIESLEPETTPERERESWEAMLQRLKAEPAEEPAAAPQRPVGDADVDRAIPEPPLGAGREVRGVNLIEHSGERTAVTGGHGRRHPSGGGSRARQANRMA